MTDMTSMVSPRASDPFSRKIDAGGVWRMTSYVFGRAPWTFILLGLLPFPIAILVELFKLVTEQRSQAATAIVVTLTLLQYLVQFITQNAMIYGAGRVIDGAAFTTKEALSVGLQRLPSVLCVGVLVGLLVVLGLILLVVPGLIAAMALSVAISACVLEQRGPIKAIKRSIYLTRTNRWRVFGAFVLVVFVPILAVLFVGGTMIGVFYAMHTEFSVIVATFLAVLFFVPLILIMPPISMILLAVLFVELRRIREGIGSREGLIEAF